MDNILSKNPPVAKNVTLYRNGDSYYRGRKFVVNRRQINNFDAFLQYATDGLNPPFGAVRNIYTPDGGTRVRNMEEIQSGRAYVAGGAENFRALNTMRYAEIGTRKPKPIKKTYSHIKPVSHSHRHQQIHGRWRQVAEEINAPIQVYLCVNGDSLTPPVRLLLQGKVLKQPFDLILQTITDKVGIRLGKAVRKLTTIDGRPVKATQELESGHTYVACGQEPYRKRPYRSGGQSMSAPVRKRLPLPPLKKTRRAKSPEMPDVQNQYEDIIDKMTKERGEAKPSEDIFSDKPVKVKTKQKVESMVSVPKTAVAPVTTGPPKSNSKQKPSPKAKIPTDYIEEAANVTVEVPVEQQTAKTVKNASGKNKKTPRKR